jgi:hypothetical protein
VKWFGVAGAVVLVLIGVFLALALTGPKYEVYCDPGHVLRTRAEFFYQGQGEICVSKYMGKHFDDTDWRGTRLRRLGLLQRAWYSIVGSKRTRD